MVWCCDRHIGLDASHKYGIIIVYPRIDRVDRIATTREELVLLLDYECRYLGT